MLELPNEFLNFYYFYGEVLLANKNQQPIGIVNFNLSRGLIMLFTLTELKAGGCKQAYLRVHVKNSPAIRLYGSRGFSKAERYKTLIWTINNTSI